MSKSEIAPPASQRGPLIDAIDRIVPPGVRNLLEGRPHEGQASHAVRAGFKIGEELFSNLSREKTGLLHVTLQPMISPYTPYPLIVSGLAHIPENPDQAISVNYFEVSARRPERNSETGYSDDPLFMYKGPLAEDKNNHTLVRVADATDPEFEVYALEVMKIVQRAIPQQDPA